jgi:hypothetical protein
LRPGTGAPNARWTIEGGSKSQSSEIRALAVIIYLFDMGNDSYIDGEDADKVVASANHEQISKTNGQNVETSMHSARWGWREIENRGYGSQGHKRY